jgi:hypothetical protein
MTGNTKPEQPSRGRRRPRLSSPMSIGLTLVAALAVGGLAISRGVVDSAAVPTPSSTPANVGQASPPPTDPAPSSQPTPLPSIVITGVLPEPDATSDPKAPSVIPGLRIETIAGAAEAAGLACQSDLGSFPGVPAGYTLSCTEDDRAAHANVAVTAIFWSLDSISNINVNVWSDAQQTVISPTFPSALFARVADLATNSAGSGWLQGRVGALACSSGCAATFGAVHIALSVGVAGGQQLTITR